MFTDFFSKNTSNNIEIITIIGCGIAGAAIAYQLSKQAKAMQLPVKIRVIEQANRDQIPNPIGSSHSKSRITRIATAEGEIFIPYAKRSQKIIQELEEKTGEILHIHYGGLIIGPDGKDNWPCNSAANAQKNNIDCATKNSIELSQNYNMLNVTDSEIAYFEPTMGMLIPEKCHNALINLAEKQGAEFLFAERFIRFESSLSDTIQVHTDKGNSYQTGQTHLNLCQNRR